MVIFTLTDIYYNGLGAGGIMSESIPDKIKKVMVMVTLKNYIGSCLQYLT